jgi:hemoglobin
MGNPTAVFNYGANARKEELLEKIGGKKVLHDAVDRFYSRLVRDETLGVFFNDSNILLLKWHQFNFMSIAFSKVPEELDVNRLVLDKHRRLFDIGLAEEHFDRMIEHLKATFSELELDAEVVEQAVLVLEPLRVVFQQGSAQAKARKSSQENWRKLQTVLGIACVGLIVVKYASRHR